MRVLPSIASITSIVLSFNSCTKDEKPFDCAYQLMMPQECCGKYRVAFDLEVPPTGFVYYACLPAGQEGGTYVYERPIDDMSADAWTKKYVLDSAGRKIWVEGKLTNWSAGYE